ncbi:response regulator transcription factor [Nonomuraea sp. NPDC050404]|uniref:response regulator transcription factor n=1 Tax=Nonomuraea sp. NPDC050404 TaxID=3155783 RepID=UPI0034039AB2
MSDQDRPQPDIIRLLTESHERARAAVAKAVDVEAGLREITRPDPVHTPKGKPTVLVVEDESSLSDALTYALGRSGFDVVGVAVEGREAVELVRQTRPDVVTMDLMLPGMDGYTATEIITQEHPSTRIVMLTARDSRVDLFRGLSSGAVGFVTKPFSLDELIATIREALDGGYPIAAPIMASMPPPGRSADARVPSISLFTELEARVMRLLADNLSIAEIAKATGFSVREITELQTLIIEKIKLRNAIQTHNPPPLP